MRRFVAEIGSCNGDISFAGDMVEAFASVGVTDVKGQLYQADSLTSKTAVTYGKGIDEPTTQHEAFDKALSYDQWGIVAAHCETLGVNFFGSVFDMAAVDAGLEQGWTGYKLASADITYRQLIQAAASAAATTGAEVIMSTGAATEQEIDRAVSWVTDYGISPTVLACTLAYPTETVDANVDRMDTLRRWTDRVGYSDHTRGLAAADYAYRQGAVLVEKHVTITPGAGGDHDFASTPDDVARLLRGDVSSTVVSDALVAGSPVLGYRESEEDARRLARRSWHAVVDIGAGTVIESHMIAALRPATGIDPSWDIIGRTTSEPVRAGQPMRGDYTTLTHPDDVL